MSCTQPGTWDMLGSLDDASADVDVLDSETNPDSDQSNDPDNDPEPVPSAWDYRLRLTIDNSGSASTLTDYPLLVRMNSMGIDLNLIADRTDFTFKSDDGTETFPYELESSWNPGGSPVVWVKISQIPAGSTRDIWMYYRSDTETGVEDPASVWSNSYQGVWHLNEGGSPYSDSSGTGPAAVPGSWVSPLSTGGIFAGNGIETDSPNAGLSAGGWGTGSESSEMTISFWFRQNGLTAGSRLFHKGDLEIKVADGANNLEVSIDTDGSNPLFCRYPPAEWYRTTSSWIVVTWDGTQSHTGIKLYCNGIQAAPSTWSTGDGGLNLNPGDGKLFIANSSNGGTGTEGLWDDFKLSDSVRSDGWIGSAWKGYNNTLISFGTQEALF